MKFYKLRIICGILCQEYLKMLVKIVDIYKDIKLENLNSSEFFFFIYKNSIFLLWPNVARFFKNSFFWEDESL